MLFPPAAQAQAQAQEIGKFPDEASLSSMLGKGALRIEDEGVLHYYWWRHEVPMSWQDRPVEVFEGKSLRFSVRKDGEECLGSGRWLVFSDEVIPVVTALAGGGLRVTSVVPRFPGSTPQGFDVRFLGRGTETELAGPVAAAHSRIEAIRRATALPPDRLPTSESYGPSDIGVAQLETLFGSKAEVKDGVPLFRLPGPPTLAGQPAGIRMGFAVFAAFAGTDAQARARVDWTLRPSEVAPLLDSLGRQGFVLESLSAAAPGFDDELTQVSLVARGPVMDLAQAVAGELVAMAPPAKQPDQEFHSPEAPECLGLKAGRLGEGWHSAATLPAGSERARWTVQDDAELGPIASMQDPGAWDSKTFNLLWNEQPRFQDGSITLRMRADRGRIDQGGGPIWRVQDANNYYVCRFNPLEQDFRVYYVQDGVRVQIQAYGSLPYQSGDWYTIRVDQVGDQITCTLNDSIVLRVRDDHIAGPGGVGVWSKADSQPSVAGLWVEGSSQDGR
ncbi:MAG TPA: DUF1259 domain-containing protein [Planctomycetota bacterium]|nr:DUF1259 domain-containing protein [Planctomycetota bacterium]